MNWQPIDTAPKDGKTILLAWDQWGWEYSVAFYEGGAWVDDSSEKQIHHPEYWAPLTPPVADA